MSIQTIASVSVILLVVFCVLVVMKASRPRDFEKYEEENQTDIQNTLYHGIEDELLN